MIPAALRQAHPPLQVPTQRLLLVNASTVAVPDPLQPRRLPTLPSNCVRVVLLRQVRKDHFTSSLLSEHTIPCLQHILQLALNVSHFSRLRHSLVIPARLHSRSFFSGAGS
jgi:hypothetical protein